MAKNLTKVDSLERARTAQRKGIIDESDLRDLEYIDMLIKKGNIKAARKSMSKLDSLVIEYAPEFINKTITGSVVVNFNITSDDLDTDDMIEFMKNQLEQYLTKEWQFSSCEPDMKTFKTNN